MRKYGHNFTQYEVVTEETGISIFGSKRKKIRVLYGVEKAVLLGYRALRGCVSRGLYNTAQLSPKWRKTQKAAENDLKSWRVK